MQVKKKAGLGQNNAQSKWFYWSLVVIPLAQFGVFWVAVNFNSILLAFKKFDADATKLSDFHWSFKNFTHWFSDKSKWTVSGTKYGSEDLFPALGVTAKSYLISLCTSLPLGLFFSYYMFKKMPGAKLFRVLLFMPSIISAAPLSLIFKYLMINFLGNSTVHSHDGIINNYFWHTDKTYTMMMIFTIFIGFGTSVLMYTNKMDGIAPEIIESAHLDGADGVKEFWYIVLPQAFSIVQVFLVTGFAGAFSAQYNAYTLFTPAELGPKNTSIGFLLWNGVRDAGVQMWELAPYAALGLLMTAVVAPLTFLFRWLINKVGWKEE